MTQKSVVAAFALICLSSSGSFAAATTEEAARILGSLQKYVGSEAGVVAVVPEGDDYAITFDAAPLFKKYGNAGFSGTLDPVILKVRPNGDGTWAVSNSTPYKLSYKVAGLINADMSFETFQWDAVFDEALGGFTDSKYVGSNFKVAQTVTDPTTQSSSQVDYSIAQMSGGSTSTKTADGIADVAAAMTMSGIVTNTVMAPTLNYSTKLDKVDYTATIKGFHTKAVLDLMAWFVAHPSEAAIVADQAQLKEKLGALLPIWENLDGAYSGENFVVTTSMGDFNMKKAGFSANANGVVKAGTLREAFYFEGLTIPAGLTPPWSADLLPTDTKFDFSLDGFDLETPTKKVLAEFDLSKKPPLPPETEAQLLPIFLPGNAVGITLHPGAITAPAYSLSYEGKVNASLSGFPNGQLTFRMKGMEDVLAKVQAAAATDPMAQQAMGGLVAAKGFGKADADGTLVWVIDMTADSKVLINGIDMSAMLGMAPPAPAQ